MPLALYSLSNLSYRTGRLRQGITHAERVLLTSQPASIEVLAAQRAATYVALAATVEVFLRELIDELVAELNSLGLAHDRVKPSLLVLAHASDFDALRVLAGLKMWNRRALVLEGINATNVLQLSSDVRPLDGRTIRPRHLETVWRVFGLPGRPLASPAHGLALTELAEARNNIAHGHVDPVMFGRRKVLADVISAIDRVDDIALHAALAVEDYFVKASYLR